MQKLLKERVCEEEINPSGLLCLGLEWFSYSKWMIFFIRKGDRSFTLKTAVLLILPDVL